MILTKKLILPLFATLLFRPMLGKSNDADTARLDIKVLHNTNDQIMLFYHRDGKSVAISNNKSIDDTYSFAIPAEKYVLVSFMINNPHNMLIDEKGFTPKPQATLLLSTSEKVTVTVESTDQLNMKLVATDPEVLRYETYAKTERQYKTSSWAQLKAKRSRTSTADQIKEYPIDDIRRQFIEQNKNSYAALLVFSECYQTMPLDSAKRILDSLAVKNRQTYLWKEISERLTLAGKASEGNKIPTFMAQQRDGSTFNSTALAGKYWLIDFWGSWCQPCRASHPMLKQLYDKYHSSGLDILGIAYESGSMENQQTQWNKAIEEDGIYWHHILNSPENDLVSRFGITSYPTKILVDPEGLILFRTGNGKASLEDILSKIFNHESK